MDEFLRPFKLRTEDLSGLPPVDELFERCPIDAREQVKAERIRQRKDRADGSRIQSALGAACCDGEAKTVTPPFSSSTAGPGEAEAGGEATC